MSRISLFVLMALLAGAAVPIVNAAEQPQHIAQAVNIGWTKAQVRKALGKPTRTASNGNVWYYGQWAIQFTNGRVSGFPGGQG